MTHGGSLKHKLRWQLFAIFFPEVLTSMAAEQWESANQSVQTFKELRCEGWTMTHAFFADMGGFFLCPPDTSPFPVTAEQVAYLVKRQHLGHPKISKELISDRSKADGLAKVATSFQMYGFRCNALRVGNKDSQFHP